MDTCYRVLRVWLPIMIMVIGVHILYYIFLQSSLQPSLNSLSPLSSESDDFYHTLERDAKNITAQVYKIFDNFINDTYSYSSAEFIFNNLAGDHGGEDYESRKQCSHSCNLNLNDFIVREAEVYSKNIVTFIG